MEGPSIIILKEAVKPFRGEIIQDATGYASIDLERLKNQPIVDFKTWGKHFIIQFSKFSLRIHFLMFGSYRVNEKKKNRNSTLSLMFRNGELNCYTCSVKLLEGPLSKIYDWELDIMSPRFNINKVRKLLLENKEEMIGDLMLNPSIFSGVGNIIRNETLYRVKVHPDSKVASLSRKKLTGIIDEARHYSFDFLQWKKKNQLKKHWQIYTRKKCPIGHPINKKYTGKTKRRSFICACLKKYPSR